MSDDISMDEMIGFFLDSGVRVVVLDDEYTDVEKSRMARDHRRRLVLPE